MRFKVFLGAFLGYSAYYLVRKNLSLAAPGMIAEGLITKAQVGVAMSAVSIAYAFSKFILGSISDRSDARKFLVLGLVPSALVMMLTGIIPFSPDHPVLNMAIVFGLMLIVGCLSGMGWPPCGRIMAHWFSQNGVARASRNCGNDHDGCPRFPCCTGLEGRFYPPVAGCYCRCDYLLVAHPGHAAIVRTSFHQRVSQRLLRGQVGCEGH